MKIKGVVIQARKEFVRSHFGETAWQKVVESLPEQDREALGRTTLSTSWYPFEVGSRLDDAIVKVAGRGQKGVFEELGAASARTSLAKEHKPFLSANPQAFMKKAGVIYGFYYNTGRREYEQTGPTSGVMTTFDSESYSAPDCLTVVGWYKEALRLCGARDVEAVEEQCRARGDSCCRYRFQWTTA